MTHVEQLQQKITEARAEVSRIDRESEQVKAELGSTLTGTRPDERAADTLQQKRDDLSRRKERAEIRLEALTTEMPAAEKADAQERLAEIAVEVEAMAEIHAAARLRFEKALAELSVSVDAAYEPAVLRVTLRSEAEFLSTAFDLPMPALPETPQPEPYAVKDIYVRCVGFYERLYGYTMNEWDRKLSELRRERKQAQAAADWQKRRESGHVQAW